LRALTFSSSIICGWLLNRCSVVSPNWAMYTFSAGIHSSLTNFSSYINLSSPASSKLWFQSYDIQRLFGLFANQRASNRGNALASRQVSLLRFGRHIYSNRYFKLMEPVDGLEWTGIERPEVF
jgi:hypothetical protein